MQTSTNTFLESCNGYPFFAGTDANVASTASTLAMLNSVPQYQQPAVYVMHVEPAYYTPEVLVSVIAAPPTTIAVVSPQAVGAQPVRSAAYTTSEVLAANAGSGVAGNVFQGSGGNSLGYPLGFPGTGAGVLPGYGCQSAVSQFIPSGANAWQGLIADYNRPYNQLRQGYGGGAAW